jgi:aldose 1-epimerase
VFADSYLPLDGDQLPTGHFAAVDGTVFDLRQPHDLAGQVPFDTPFVLSAAPRPGGLVPAARLVSRRSGLALDVATTKPGLQVYDGRYISSGLTGLRGAVYGPRAGLCLETQFHPDSPNQPGFPDTILRPGRTYAHRTEFVFSRTA